MMRAADRLPCCALCALRIIFKPPFRFMPRVRCVGVKGGSKTRSRPERSGGSARPGFRPNGTAAAFPPLLAGQKRQNRCF